VRSSEELLSGSFARPPVVALIRRDHPDWSPEDRICVEDLHEYRMRHVEHLLRAGDERLTRDEREVLASIERQELVAEDPMETYDETLTVGERAADRLSTFGGSWPFIGLFGTFIGAWVAVNALALFGVRFDPYPFILLNLVLSCLAAIQAPIIMMSQNRQADLDRTKASYDYQVNLKAELEVRQLNDKLDYLLLHHWKRLMALQESQTELLEEALDRPGTGEP